LAVVRPLDVLARPESLTLLRRLAPRLETTPDADLDPLAERLGDLPLALDLAGRYLRDRPLTPAQYLEKLRETALKHRSLKAAGTGSPTRHATDVELTFLLSWEQLQENACDTLAKRFFIAAGYLAPNLPIPRDIFYWLCLPDDWRKQKMKRPDENMQENAEDALLRLQVLGLLTETLTLHPLLAEFARAQASDNALLTALADKMVSLSTQAGETGIPADFAPLLPHLEALAPAAERAGLAEAGLLWNNLGYHQSDVAEYPAARAAYERALALDEKTYGAEHPVVAIAANNLGTLAYNMSDLPGAKACLERALTIDEKTYGKDHPKVAIRVNNLGMVLKGMGDLPSAQTYIERALAMDEKIYGREHPNVARDVNNLGQVLQTMGDLPGAKACYERALAIDEKAFGQRHPSVAIRLHNLAALLANMGDLPQALDHEQHALAMFQKFLPPEHPYIESSRWWLAEIERRMGESNQ
jgi:tetratricopeptide (TPR) repeat protein